MWIFFLLFFLFILFLFLIFIFLPAKSPQSPNFPIGPTGSVGYGFSCLTNPCQTNLICDKGTITCRLPNGSVCQQSSQCVTGSFCSGICVTGPFGNLGQPCPCNSGLTCVNRGNALICLLNQGENCMGNSDCASDNCVSGVCEAGLPPASACTSNIQCGLFVCDSFGFCQPPGVTSGTVGAFCIIGQPPPGTPGATAAGCDPGNLCNGITCAPGNRGLGEACNGTNLCDPPLICTSTETELPCVDLNSGGCQCLYPGDANTCPNEVCTVNFQCNTLTQDCLGQPGQPCVIGPDCISGTCNSVGSFYQLSLQGNIIGSSFLSWGLINSTPAPVVKLIGYSGGIFMLGNNNIVYSLVGTTWTPIITGNANMILISICVNNSGVFLVSFNQTTGMINGNTVYTYAGNTLTPFNVIPRVGFLDGTQYDTLDNEIIIKDMDISINSDVLLLDNSNNPMVKAANQTKYSLRPKTTGMNVGPPVTNVTLPRFYFDLPEPGPISWPSDFNFGYVQGASTGNILQFNGNISGQAYPRSLGNPTETFSVADYSIFSPSNCPPGLNCGMPFSTIGIISFDSLFNVYFPYLISQSIQLKLPGFVDINSKILVVDEQNIYLYTAGRCN